MATCTELVGHGQPVTDPVSQPLSSAQYPNLPAPSVPFYLSADPLSSACKAHVCLNDTALSAQWSYQAAKLVPIIVTTTWAIVNGRTQGHQPSTFRPLRGPGQGVGNSMLPRMSEARLQVLLRNQPAGRNQGLATPGPLLQHEGLSSQQMGYWERGAALWECFLEEEEEVWAFGLVEGGESSLPSRGTIVGNQWQ